MRNWTFTKYNAISPNKEVSLWIANGFMYFREDGTRTGILKGLSLWQRWKLWRLIRKEQKLRSAEFLSLIRKP